MSEGPGGPNWWQASDGRWYPPDTAPPAYKPAPPSTTSPKARNALGLAILAFFLGPLGPLAAFAAVVTGNKAATEIENGYGRYHGSRLIKASRALVLVNLALVAFVAGVLGVKALSADPASGLVYARRTQADLRDALTAEKVFYTDNARYTDKATDLEEIEPDLSYVTGDGPTNDGAVVVTATTGEVWLAAQSRNGTCYYLYSTVFQVTYAADAACGAVSAQTYGDYWR